jgi:hypothetical protein
MRGKGNDMKRQLTASALALLCLGTPAAAKEDHEDDKMMAGFFMFSTGRVKAADCPNVVHTERVGPERILVATCDNKEAYVIVYSENESAVVSCTWLIAQNREATLKPCHNRRRLPNIIRGAY